MMLNNYHMKFYVILLSIYLLTLFSCNKNELPQRDECIHISSDTLQLNDSLKISCCTDSTDLYIRIYTESHIAPINDTILEPNQYYFQLFPNTGNYLIDYSTDFRNAATGGVSSKQITVN